MCFWKCCAYSLVGYFQVGGVVARGRKPILLDHRSHPTDHIVPSRNCVRAWSATCRNVVRQLALAHTSRPRIMHANGVAQTCVSTLRRHWPTQIVVLRAVFWPCLCQSEDKKGKNFMATSFFAHRASRLAEFRARKLHRASCLDRRTDLAGNKIPISQSISCQSNAVLGPSDDAEKR